MEVVGFRVEGLALRAVSKSCRIKGFQDLRALGFRV